MNKYYLNEHQKETQGKLLCFSKGKAFNNLSKHDVVIISILNDNCKKNRQRITIKTQIIYKNKHFLLYKYKNKIKCITFADFVADKIIIKKLQPNSESAFLMPKED